MAKVTLTFKSSAMKSYLLFLSLAFLVTGCSTIYKSGQTPDDVYYSPAPVQGGEDYVQASNQDNKAYRYEDHTPSSAYSLSDEYYSYNPFYYSMSNYNLFYSNPYYNPMYSNYWSPLGYNNYYYNPYYAHVVIVNPPSSVYNRPRMFNLNVYNNPANIHGSRTFGNTTQGNGNSNNYRGSGTNAGNFLRNVFGSTGSNGNSTQQRSYSNSNQNSSSAPSRSTSSGSGGGGGSAPVRHF